jgi:hypothetical protein
MIFFKTGNDKIKQHDVKSSQFFAKKFNAWKSHSPVSNMSAVVDAKPHGDDQVDAGHRVDGQAPEVHEPADVCQRKDNHEQDLGSILRIYSGRNFKDKTFSGSNLC